jgi:hypothetical protein
MNIEINLLKAADKVDPSLVDVVSALLVPTIAIVGAAIAYLQWNTNQKRLKHELFDRRYSQFEAIRNFLGSIMTSGKVTDEAERKYLIGTRGIRFIFDDEIHNYNEYLWGLSNQLRALKSMLEGVPVGNERSANVQKQAAIKKELADELKQLEVKFAKYLALKH